MNPGVVAIFIPILVLMIPIIAILVNHQQKMAQIFANQRHHEQDPEIAALRDEVRELKQLIHQQAIAMDNVMSSRLTSPPPTPSVSERLNVGGY